MERSMWPLNEWSHAKAPLRQLLSSTTEDFDLHCFSTLHDLASNQNAVGIAKQHGRGVSQTFILTKAFNGFLTG